MKTISDIILHNHLQKHYAFGADATLQPITIGEENRNFFVTVGGEQYVLRVYSTHHSTTGERKLQEIEFELDLLEAARTNGIPTPPVIQTKSGARVATITFNVQSHYAVLFGYAQGEAPPEYTPAIARATASVLLVLRRVSVVFGRSSPRPWPGDIVRLSLDFYAAHRDRIIHHRDILDTLYQSASAGYTQILSANLPTGVIHGDVKLSNLLVQGNRITAVIDFDDYRETFLLEEFTRTVMHDLDSPTRNAIRAGFYPVFRDTLAADPTITSAEMAHLGTFLRARLVYDLAAYALAGHSDLVDAVLSDHNVRAVLLAGL